MFQNNLILLRKQKIPNIITLKRISGLSALCRIFNQSILDNGDNSKLSNKHYCVQLSMTDIYEKMRKPAQKKYHQYQQGNLKINDGLLRHDIRMLIIAEVIRKVDLKELTPHVQTNISTKKKDFHDGKTTDNVYASAPYYEVLDLNNSHLERLTKIKNQKDLSYPIVQQLFGRQIADNCFNSVMRNYKNGLDDFGEGSFMQIIDIIKENEVVPIKNLAEYCAHNLSLNNGKYKPQTWWYKQLRGFDFKQEGITIRHNSELSQEDKLDIRGNSLVLVG